MKELVDKLSSYNLFNYLLPGTLFVAFSEWVTQYSFVQENIVIGLFLYYFIGLVVSRIGSLVIEPILKKVKFVEFAPYPDFVTASSKDPKLEVLSESNNMYRTLCALFVSIGGLKVYELIATQCQCVDKIGPGVLLVLLFVLFCVSYRKQTGYIKKRVEASK